MSRILGAGSASEPDRQPSDGFRSQDIPSGLASLIFHFALLILLGLLYFEPPASALTEVILEWQDSGDAELVGGGGGPDELADAEFDAPAEFEPFLAAADDELVQALPEVVSDFVTTPAAQESATAPPALETPALDSTSALADLAAVGQDGLRGIGSGGGTGGGRGRGHGRVTGNRSGPSSSTSMFGLADEGARIVYVFDRSESMNSVFTLTSGSQSVSITPLDAAKTELMKSLNDLSDGAEFQIIFYNDEPAAFPDPLAEAGISHATPQTKALAQSFVYGMIAERNTQHVPALEMALKLKPDVVFLLTDGEAKDDPSSAQVRGLEKLCRRTGTRINVIHFCVDPRTTSSLIGLAKKTGGQFTSITFRSLLEPNWRRDAGR